MRKIGRIPYKWLALFTASIGSFVATLDASIVSISFPSLTKAFSVKPSVVLWVTVVYLLVSVNLMLPVGKLGDLLGRKRIYVIGFSLFTVGLVLCSLSQSITQIILSRMIQGTGAAMIISLGTAIVVAAFPTTERGKALGILGAVVSAGLLTGPVMGGFLLDILDWRAIFYSRIPIGIIGTVMALTLLKEQRGHGNQFRFDWCGAVVLCITLSCLLLFCNLGGRLGYRSPLVLALAGATMLLLFLFVVQEKRTSEPVVDLNLFKNPLFTSGNISLSIMFFAFGSYTFLMPFYLIDGLGHSSSQTGLMISVVSLITLVIAPFSGWLSDKIGFRALGTVGMAFISMALLLISRLDIESSTTDVVLRLVVFGIGVGLFQSPNNSSIIGSAPKNRLGTAAAMIATIRQISISLGLTISGTVLASYQFLFAAQFTQSGINPLMISKLSLVRGFQNTLFLASMVCSIGILTSFMRGKQKTIDHDTIKP